MVRMSVAPIVKTEKVIKVIMAVRDGRRGDRDKVRANWLCWRSFYTFACGDYYWPLFRENDLSRMAEWQNGGMVGWWDGGMVFDDGHLPRAGGGRGTRLVKNLSTSTGAPTHAQHDAPTVVCVGGSLSSDKRRLPRMGGVPCFSAADVL